MGIIKAVKTKQPDGPKLKAFLQEHGISPRKFSDAAHVSEVSAYRFFKSEKWARHTWTKIENGLTSLKIDPSPITPEGMRAQPVSQVNLDELYKIIDEFKDAKLLDRLLYILSMDKQQTETIRAICGYQQRDGK